MKRIGLVVIALCGLVAFAGPTSAKERELCCGVGSSCTKTERLPKSGTIEFQGMCKSGTRNYLPDRQKCSARSDNVSCTITVDHITGVAKTCSCTNWSTTKSFDAKIEIRC